MNIAALDERRAQRRADGCCSSCDAEAEEGKTLCAEHLRYQREHHRELRAKRRAAGLCVQCGRPSGGKALCDNHGPSPRLERRRALIAHARDAWRAKQRAAGLCLSWLCSQPAAAGGELCAEHGDADLRRKADTAYQHQRNLKRHAAGLCVACGWPNERKAWLCSDCYAEELDRQQVRRNERKAAGLCTCGRPPRHGKMRCATCNEGDRKRAAVRRERAREAGICEQCNERRVDERFCAKHREQTTERRAQRKRIAAGIVLRRAA